MLRRLAGLPSVRTLGDYIPWVENSSTSASAYRGGSAVHVDDSYPPRTCTHARRHEDDRNEVDGSSNDLVLFGRFLEDWAGV